MVIGWGIGAEQLPGKCDGHHEEVDEQQVQRKKPQRLADIAGIIDLHHANLKLPGQHKHGQRRHAEQGRPVFVAGVLAQEPIHRTAEIDVAAAEVIHCDASCHQKCQQLHHAFYGNGAEQAGLGPRAAHVARTINDGEQAHDGGNVQSGIAPEVGDATCLHGIELSEVHIALSHCFDLQRNIRKHPK